MKTLAVAVGLSMAWEGGAVEPPRGVGARERLAAFRGELYRSLTARPDGPFELADAVLWAGAGPAPGRASAGGR